MAIFIYTSPTQQIYGMGGRAIDIRFYLRYTYDDAPTVYTLNILTVGIEYRSAYAGESFRLEAGSTGGKNVRFNNADHSSSATRSSSTTLTISAANTWERNKIVDQEYTYNISKTTSTIPVTISFNGNAVLTARTTSSASPSTIQKAFNGSSSITVPTLQPFTIAYYGNGGTGTAPVSQTVYYGSGTYPRSNTFTRTGYHWSKWNTASNGSGYSYTTSDAILNVTSNINLYAIWTPNTYTINYSAAPNASSVSGSTASSTHTYDVQGRLTTNGFKRTGYSFYGWSTTSGGARSYTDGQSVKNLYTSGTHTLYALWTINSYTLTANANGGSIPSTTGWSGTGNTATKTVVYGNTYSTLPAPTRPGYTFAGWYTAASGGDSVNTSTTMGAANTTIYAHWTANTYYISYNANNGTGAPAQQSYTYGQSTAVYLSSNIPTRSNYTFMGWSLSNTATSASYSARQQWSTSNRPSSGSTYTLYAVWKKTYIAPYLKINHIERVSQDSTDSTIYNLDDEGTYGQINITYTQATLGGDIWNLKNSLITIEYRLAGVDAFSELETITITNNVNNKDYIIGGELDSDKSYYFRLKGELNTSTESDKTITTPIYSNIDFLSTAQYSIDINADGDTIGFFRTAPDEDDAEYIPNTIYTMGPIRKPGQSVTYKEGRDTAIATITSAVGYSAVTSIKTVSGSWETGTYSASSTPESLMFIYIPDSTYNSDSNTGMVYGPYIHNDGSMYFPNGITGNVNLKSGNLSVAGDITSANTYRSVTETYSSIMLPNGNNGWIKIGTSDATSANSGIGYGLLPCTSGNAGSGHGYLGTSSWYWKNAYIDNIYGTLNGNATSATSATYAYTLLGHNSNEVTLGANSSTPGASTNNRIWFNYRDIYGGTATNNSTAITEYYFGNRKGAVTGVTVYAATFSGNATSATKATQDGSGNTITSTYVKKAGDEMTGLLKITANGNTVTIGSANTGWCHFSNSASRPFYFSHQVTVNGNILPYTNNATNLGSATAAFKNLYTSAAIIRTTAPGANAQTYAASWAQLSDGYYYLTRPSSSRKYKKDIETISDGFLDPHKLYDLRVVQFRYKTKDKDDPNNSKHNPTAITPGFIAEEVGEIYPAGGIINENDEIDDWDLRTIVPPMLALVQEQHKDIEQLKEEIQELKSEIQELKQLIK